MEGLNDFIKILKEHWRFRQQLLKLAKADLIKTYRGAALGWAWAIIKPVVQIFVYWFGRKWLSILLMVNSRTSTMVLYE